MSQEINYLYKAKEDKQVFRKKGQIAVYFIKDMPYTCKLINPNVVQVSGFYKIIADGLAKTSTLRLKLELKYCKIDLVFWKKVLVQTNKKRHAKPNK